MLRRGMAWLLLLLLAVLPWHRVDCDARAPQLTEKGELSSPISLHETVCVTDNHSNRTVVDVHSHTSLAWCSFFVLNCLGLAIAVGQWVHEKHIDWLPESCVFILIGVLLGVILRLMVVGHTLEEWFGFINISFLNFLLLPPVIFESGWSLRVKDFVSQLEYIVLFAVMGTAISTIIVANLVNALGHLENWYTVFTFAALISAVDPVATLATYSALKVEPLLNIMVFGESVINDAVAIVLFKAGNDVVLSGKELYVAECARDMCILLFGSILIGIFMGVAIIVRLRFSKFALNTDTGGWVMSLSPYIIYTFAEALHFSGIVATLFCGIFVAVTEKRRLSLEFVTQLDKIFKQSASTADILIFMFVGMAACLTKPFADLRVVIFGLKVLLFCLVARALAIFPLGMIVNLVKKSRGDTETLLSWRHLAMMWHAGLRGGIAMALVLELNTSSPDEKQLLMQTTFLIICVLLFVCGGSTKFCLGWLQIPVGQDRRESELVKDGSKRFVVAQAGRSVIELIPGAASADSSFLSKDGGQSGEVEDLRL